MPTNPIIANLILYIVDRLNDKGRYPSTIQLVKYLYLIDLEHQRRYNKPLTDLKWIFYEYGPYPFEFPDLTESLGFDLSVETFNSDIGTTRIHTAQVEPVYPNELGNYSQSLVDITIDRWAFVPTKELLDYVYFETEPMIDARRGDLLDLRRAQAEDIGTYQLNFRNTKRLRELREQYKKPLEGTGRIRRTLTERPDDIFTDVMNKMDDQDGW
jgi:Protein of unknown function (DUF4065)